MTEQDLGAPLSTIARRWARDIDQDYDLVASILYCFARGDYFNRDPNLALFLSGPDQPTPIPKPVDVSLEDILAGKADPQDPPSPNDYLVHDIEVCLRDYDPPLSYHRLAGFCSNQGIPCPEWICSSLQGGAAEPLGDEAPDYLFHQNKAGTWDFRFEGRNYDAMKDYKGFWYIKHLLQNPHKLISAIDLSNIVNNPVGDTNSILPSSTAIESDPEVSAANEPDAIEVDVGWESGELKGLLDSPEEDDISDTVSTSPDDEAIGEWGSTFHNIGDAGEFIDSQARAAYKTSLTGLERKRQECIECNELAKAEEIEEMMERIKKELIRGVNIRGRLRKDKSTYKRAKQAVGNAIRRSISKLNEQCPELGQHLQDTISTGGDVVYHPETPVRWQF